ncbi:hypothetical protein C2845_PM04G01760 [Panicum miliaceum]|uniref:Cell differentiation protein RCD1-like protein n=1 Tax=Panicum miliaceum TaxID=4540 RepID=A0A3L6QRG6_PANMI|nr:hypothetical protein C2845_PM04G01760 [Panicum miliaceum]
MAGSCDAVVPDIKMKLEEQLVLNLCNPELRGNALIELSKKREMLPDLAPPMWHSFGTMIVLLQEIVSVYPALSPPMLSASVSNRACNVLALLQYLYPFLNTTSNARSFEYLRLTTLGVFGALVKVDDTEVVNTLLNGDIIPLCLRIMETGSELSKTVATFIVQKIIIDEAGLHYICATPERFFGIAVVLARMVAEEPSTRLLKHIVRCYLRLTDDPRARSALQIHLPEALRDGTFDNGLRDDAVARRYLQKLLDNLAVPAGGAPPPVPDPAAAGFPQPLLDVWYDLHAEHAGQLLQGNTLKCVVKYGILQWPEKPANDDLLLTGLTSRKGVV